MPVFGSKHFTLYVAETAPIAIYKHDCYTVLINKWIKPDYPLHYQIATLWGGGGNQYNGMVTSQCCGSGSGGSVSFP